ncbi:hypothetical protein RUND412_001347 [Rhizina undulata]
MNDYKDIVKNHPLQLNSIRQYLLACVPQNFSRATVSTFLSLDINTEKKSKDGDRYSWKDVLLVAEHKENIDEMDKGGTKRATGHLAGAGAYGSDDFNISGEKKQFVKVKIRYAFMSLDELGFDPSIISFSTHARNPYGPDSKIKIDTPNGSPETIYLGKPIFMDRAIASRGTICWRAKRKDDDEWTLIVKDSWRSKNRTSEGVFLEGAKDIRGVVQCITYEDVQVKGKIDDVFGNACKGSGLEPAVQEHCRTESTGSESEDWGDSNKSRAHSKRKVSSSASGAAAAKRKSKVKRALSSKKEKSIDAKDANDRIHTRLVLSTVGRSIWNFHSAHELLEALRDAIKGHELLYEKDILHRDISINNIIILNKQETDEPKGFLIDLDYFKDLSAIGSQKTADHRTGTPAFMAI